MYLITEASYLDLFRKIVNSNTNKLSSQALRQGHIIAFNYRAKGFMNDTLNFYDQMPIIIVTSVEPQHFTGFNIHYIPRPEKTRLLGYLMNKYKKQFFPPTVTAPVKQTKSPVLPTKSPYSYAQLKKQFPTKSDADIKKIIAAETEKFEKQKELKNKTTGVQSNKNHELPRDQYLKLKKLFPTKTTDEIQQIYNNSMNKTDAEQKNYLKGPKVTSQLPGFSYSDIENNFPFISDACIHKYIKTLAGKISLLSADEFNGLCAFDNSKFMFSTDSPIKSVADLWKQWRNTKSFQRRTASNTNRPGA